jgi:hypothetical protein
MISPTVGNYRTDVPMPKDGKYRVITFDGGGLRSVVSIIILERLVEVFPDLLERVNLFCGTSGLAPLSLSLLFTSFGTGHGLFSPRGVVWPWAQVVLSWRLRWPWAARPPGSRPLWCPTTTL